MNAAQNHVANHCFKSMSEDEHNKSFSKLEQPSCQVSQNQLTVSPVGPDTQCCLDELGDGASGSTGGGGAGLVEGNTNETTTPPLESSEKITRLVDGEAVQMSDGSSEHLEGSGKNSVAFKKNNALGSKTSSERILRSRLQDKKPEELAPASGKADVSSELLVKQRKRKRRKKRIEKRGDEYTKIMKSLRYSLNRINYEQSLITAYSAEGWRGLSLEKLKPEKELERATKEILRHKLKIRNLFQRIDTLAKQGCLPEELFDSEGEISSEDIFCSKCGSKDLSLDNDIILCDGACDRGFHQFCLEPPLLKKDIPPNDEAWLCPGCVCKDDCIELLNESQGTRLFITDDWQKVFPEASEAVHHRDSNLELPSDESDDEDYDPEGPESNEEILKLQDQSSYDSEKFVDFDHQSEYPGMEASSKKEPFLGLPSDDSEDDDYDPDAADLDENLERESTSSDFTSDAEDFAATFNENGSDLKEVMALIEASETGSKCIGDERPSTGDGVSSLKEDTCEDVLTAAQKKRSIERLDYKKLYDETYGNVPSSSSEDEDWSENDSSIQKPKSRMKRASASKSRAGCILESHPEVENLKQSADATGHELRRGVQNSKLGSKGVNAANKSGLLVERNGDSVPKRLVGVEKQRLLAFFKENRYPDRAMKGKIAAELGIPYKKVDQWFRNMRWSFSHSSKAAATVKTVSKKDIQAIRSRKKLRSGIPEGSATEPSRRKGKKDKVGVNDVLNSIETGNVSKKVGKEGLKGSRSRKRRRP